MSTVVRVHSLHVYPIKGCAGIDVPSIRITADGLIENDRVAMIVDAVTGRFVTQREEAKLATLHATTDLLLSAPGQHPLQVMRPASETSIRVTVWDDTLHADDAGDAHAEWLSAFLGRSVRLALLPTANRRVVDPFWTREPNRQTSFADLAPALLTNVDSLTELNRRRSDVALAPVPMTRFRPNIVVAGAAAFTEDTWASLTNNKLTLTCIKPCARCKVTEIDQTAGIVMADGVLATLAAFRTQINAAGKRGVMFGQNVVFNSAAATEIHVGDSWDSQSKRD